MRFYRILCGLGHQGDLLSEGSPIPAKCPVCNQPYDRRRLNRILCNEDGTELVEECSEERRQMERTERMDSVDGQRNNTERIAPSYAQGENTERIASAHAQRENTERNTPSYGQRAEIEYSSQTHIRRENRSEVLYERENPGRRRVGQQNDSFQSDSFDTGDGVHRARRRIDVINEERIEPRKNTARSENTGRRIITYENDTIKYCIYSSGVKLPVPVQGIYLGRGEYGSECMGMNTLISRRHAYLEDQGFGELLIKDADSLNGTYIDDGNGRRRLLQEEAVKLKKGDKFWLADQLFVVDEE